MTASLMLALDWKSGLYGGPLTLWLLVGWLLVSAGALTLLAFLLRLLPYGVGEIVVDRLALRDRRDFTSH